MPALMLSAIMRKQQLTDKVLRFPPYVYTQVLVVCSGLLIYAATHASIVFILSIFIPPITIAGAYLYSKWIYNDYALIIWPPL